MKRRIVYSNMDKQNMFAVMEWPTDGYKLSIHHLKYIKEPAKSWNSYKVGDEGQAVYPGTRDLWPFKILAVGTSRQSLKSEFAALLRKRDASTDTSDGETHIDNSTVQGSADSPLTKRKRKRGPKKNSSTNNAVADNEDEETVDPALKKQALTSAIKTLLAERGTTLTPEEQMRQSITRRQPSSTLSETSDSASNLHCQTSLVATCTNPMLSNTSVVATNSVLPYTSVVATNSVFPNTSVVATNSVFPNTSVVATNSVPPNTSVVATNSVLPSTSVVATNPMLSNTSVVATNSIPPNTSVVATNSVFPNTSVVATNSVPPNTSVVATNSVLPNTSVVATNSIPPNTSVVATNCILPNTSMVTISDSRQAFASGLSSGSLQSCSPVAVSGNHRYDPSVLGTSSSNIISYTSLAAKPTSSSSRSVNPRNSFAASDISPSQFIGPVSNATSVVSSFNALPSVQSYISTVATPYSYTCSSPSTSHFSSIDTSTDSECFPAQSLQPRYESYSDHTSASSLVHNAFGALYPEHQLQVNQDVSLSNNVDVGNTACHSCCKELAKMKKEFQEIKEEFQKLKKRAKKAATGGNGENDIGDLQVEDVQLSMINGRSKEEIEQTVHNSVNLTEAVKMVLPLVFSIEELMTCSLKGQYQSKAQPCVRPGLEEFRRNFVEGLLSRTFGVSVIVVRSKMRDRMKIVRRQHGGLDTSLKE